jgi:hypothetical protein
MFTKSKVIIFGRNSTARMFTCMQRAKFYVESIKKGLMFHVVPARAIKAHRKPDTLGKRVVGA